MDVIMIADIAWIQRGVAKRNPDKIRLDNDQLKQLIEGGVSESSDLESDVGEFRFVCRMRGIAMYSSNMDDPYVTLHIDSDEEEKEEIEVKPEDNMVALAKVQRDSYTLEVFIYNEENNDWYCHHDCLLDAPPLCLEPIQYDPGNSETEKGNLIAVGTMESVINIWDLDIMNAVVPVVNLGSKKRGNVLDYDFFLLLDGCKSKLILRVANSILERRKKRDGREQGHSDAVISLAWNKIATHVLASGGADRQILLWDLDEAKVAQVIPERTGEIQSLSWHPAEHSFILAGTLSGTVEVIDCNENTGIPSASWSFETQVEQVKWNHFNPFSAFFATDDGFLYHVDMRKPGEIIWRGQAHDGTVGGLTLSPTVRGLLVTVGHDHMMCVWKVQDDGALLKIHSERQHIGALHAAEFNPDVPTVCCIGGSANDLVRIVDASKIDVVLRHFS
ncbi:unnamed protein product [Angiostrongylus costaricensis]|uniref:WD_REPEATS_REGION domain-containing protein n=1 Tax=Angiostrongylus costaricensis TaxID=334426 RepID=A0A0R3PQ12_ANGCS|nr:unnamed protein product [Angiostrongylus costaricensis]